jgi:hypothetical protein
VDWDGQSKSVGGSRPTTTSARRRCPQPPPPVLLLVGTTPRGNSCFAFKIKKGDAYLFHKNYGVHAIMQPLSMNGNIKGLFIGFMI